MKLTEEQKKLVEDNYGLIFGFVRKHNLNFDEWHGVLSESLCKSASSFDPEKNLAFSTYAYGLFKKKLADFYRNRFAIKKNIPEEMLLYGDSQYYDSENTLFDMIKDNKNVESETLNSVVLSQYVCALDDRDKQIFFMMCNEERQETISEKVGLCQSYVSRKQKKMRKELKELLCL